MFNNLKTSYIYSSLCICFFSFFVFGQKMGTRPNENCDENKLILHRLTTLRGEIIEKYPEKDYNMPIIVIASLGTNETNQKYNLQRLKESRTFLRRKTAVPDELIVTAQVEKVKGQGRVDFYFDGELQFSIILKRNQYLNLIRGEHCDLG